MQLSIRIVVAALVILTSLFAVLFALVPPIVQLPSDAMKFVVDAATSMSDKLQFSLSVQLRTAKRAGDTLYKAASSMDLLTPDGHLNSSTLLSWVGEVVYQRNLTIVLARPDSVMVAVNPYNTLFAGAAETQFVPGYVFMYRATAPGRFFEYGFFGASAPHLPLNTTHPWAMFSTTLTWADQPIYAKLSNPHRTSPMQWTSLSPRNSSGPVSALLTYGGPFNVTGTVDPLSRGQMLSINLRSASLSTYFSSLTILGCAAIVIDSVTGAFVAGSISDSAGTFVNRTPALVNVTDLRDPKIYPILHAISPSSSSGLAIRGSDALVTCALPCLFTYWPHLNELRSGSDAPLMILFGYGFSTVYVSQIDYSAGEYLNLRLVVVVPSEDVIGAFLAGVHSSMYSPASTIACITVVLVLFVSVAFRELTDLESRLRGLASTLLPPASLSYESQAPEGMHLDASASLGDTEVKVATKAPRSVFTEFDRMIVSFATLTREMVTLRAFTMVHRQDASTVGSEPDNNSRELELLSLSIRDASRRAATAALCHGAPYDFRSSELWRVPVTTVRAEFGSDVLGIRHFAPYFVHQRQRDVLDILQRHVHCTPGASMDEFSGDQFVVHFNASGRTPRHALAALTFASCCDADVKALATLYQQRASMMCLDSSKSRHLDVPLTCGIASAVAACGMLGPSSLKVFTVISPCESQAMFLCRVAKTHSYPMLATWRAVDLSLQQMTARRVNQQSLQAATGQGGEPCSNMHTFSFVPVARACLPGEWNCLTDLFVPKRNNGVV
jgi:hypothetical protein